jgi:hypothetical protein
MDWLDLIPKLAPALTALAGAYVGARLERKTALDRTGWTIERQRSLAREAAARTEEAAARQDRRALLDPLLSAARDHAREVEDYISGLATELPERHC